MDSYKESIFEPLEYYRDYAKSAHAQNIKEHFDALVAKSGIDIEENRATVSKYKARLKHIDALNKKLRGHKLIRVLSVVLSAVALIISLIVSLNANNQSAQIFVPITSIIFGFALIFFTFGLTKKRISVLEKKINDENREAGLLRLEAEGQVAPLCALFSDNDTLHLIEKTLPQIKFDSQFLFENLEDLKNNYGFNALTDEKSSALDTLSGRLYKNPFC